MKLIDARVTTLYAGRLLKSGKPGGTPGREFQALGEQGVSLLATQTRPRDSRDWTPEACYNAWRASDQDSSRGKRGATAPNIPGNRKRVASPLRMRWMTSGVSNRLVSSKRSAAGPAA